MKPIRFRDRHRSGWVMSTWMMTIQVPTYELTPADNWPNEGLIADRIPDDAPINASIFVRGKLRKRYLVFRLDGAQRQLKSTGLEIRFNRKTRRWVVFERKILNTVEPFGVDLLGGHEPRNEGYETLRQAKASVSVSLLERLAAEA